MKRAASVLLVQGDDVWLTRRLAPTEGRHAGLYCGAGGLVEEGESFEVGARRELHEEAGLLVGEERLVLVHENEAHTSRFAYRARHYALELLPGEVPRNMPSEAGKSGEWELHPIATALEAPMVPGMREALQEVLARRARGFNRAMLKAHNE